MAECTQKCEDHNRMDYVIKDVSSRLEALDAALITLGQLSSRVTLLITIASATGALILSGCVYTLTALPNFKETYATHILETQKQMYAIQEESKNFTRAEISKINLEVCGKINLISDRVSNIEESIHIYKYQKDKK